MQKLHFSLFSILILAFIGMLLFYFWKGRRKSLSNEIFKNNFLSTWLNLLKYCKPSTCTCACIHAFLYTSSLEFCCPDLCIIARSKYSHRHYDILMEVPFAQEKWPCPYKNESASLPNTYFVLLFHQVSFLKLHMAPWTVTVIPISLPHTSNMWSLVGQESSLF